MRIHLLAASVAAAAFLPSTALAQSACDHEQQNRIASTLAGGGIGAVVGSQVSGRGARTEGSVVGGIAGAIIGNQLARASEDCARAYGYFDPQGVWHANAIEHSRAVGFINRDGQWVEGQPNGYYDARGVWRAVSQRGHFDEAGYWVPPTIDGYYDPQNRWIPIARPVDDDWVTARPDVRVREDRLKDRILTGRDRDLLTASETRRDLDRLTEISRREARMARIDGTLTPDDRDRIHVQLDDLSLEVRQQMNG